MTLVYTQLKLRDAIRTVNIVFFSITKIPRTLNPIGLPCKRSRNRFICKNTQIICLH